MNNNSIFSILLHKIYKVWYEGETVKCDQKQEL